MAELISVIVATYDRADALDACLRALARQTDRGFEVVVADDGSDTATAAVINGWVKRLGVPLKHAWHTHDGFRLAAIRNRALRISSGGYCVFLDGDCLARRDFVAAHRRLMRPGWFVTGTRVLLSRTLTERVLRDGLEPERWSAATWLMVRWARGANRMLPLVALPLGPLRRCGPHAIRMARGSNMAFWRSDLDAVDGFDAAYRGWGREDTDMFVRLIRHGVRRADGRFATAVIHLWHPEADRSALADNENLLAAVRAGTRVRAQRGVSQVVREIESFHRPSVEAPLPS